MNPLAAHALYLHDRVRVSAYAKALRRVVRRGDVVLDLGAGTGLLGLLSLRAGAGEAWMVDSGSVLHAARAVARANGLDDRAHFIRKKSHRATLPRRATLLVTETLGHLGVEEGILDAVADAHRRLMARGARVIPQRLEVRVQAASLPGPHRRWIAWRGRIAGLDFRPLRRLASNGTWILPRWPRGRLSPVRTICDFRLEGLRRNPLPAEGICALPILRKGVCHGVIGSFRAGLAPGVTLESGPRTHWRPVYFPLEAAPAVRPGDRLVFSLRIERDFHCTWGVELRRGGAVAARGRHSTGFLDSAALSRAHPLNA